jgi:hypothetical protein
MSGATNNRLFAEANSSCAQAFDALGPTPPLPVPSTESPEMVDFAVVRALEAELELETKARFNSESLCGELQHLLLQSTTEANKEVNALNLKCKALENQLAVERKASETAAEKLHQVRKEAEKHAQDLKIAEAKLASLEQLHEAWKGKQDMIKQGMFQARDELLDQQKKDRELNEALEKKCKELQTKNTEFATSLKGYADDMNKASAKMSELTTVNIELEKKLKTKDGLIEKFAEEAVMYKATIDSLLDVEQQLSSELADTEKVVDKMRPIVYQHTCLVEEIDKLKGGARVITHAGVLSTTPVVKPDPKESKSMLPETDQIDTLKHQQQLITILRGENATLIGEFAKLADEHQKVETELATARKLLVEKHHVTLFDLLEQAADVDGGDDADDDDDADEDSVNDDNFDGVINDDGTRTTHKQRYADLQKKYAEAKGEVARLQRQVHMIHASSAVSSVPCMSEDLTDILKELKQEKINVAMSKQQWQEEMQNCKKLMQRALAERDANNAELQKRLDAKTKESTCARKEIGSLKAEQKYWTSERANSDKALADHKRLLTSRQNEILTLTRSTEMAVKAKNTSEHELFEAKAALAIVEAANKSLASDLLAKDSFALTRRFEAVIKKLEADPEMTVDKTQALFIRGLFAECVDDTLELWRPMNNTRAVAWIVEAVKAGNTIGSSTTTVRVYGSHKRALAAMEHGGAGVAMRMFDGLVNEPM